MKIIIVIFLICEATTLDSRLESNAIARKQSKLLKHDMNLLDSYLPAAMQLLAYHIDLLQYVNLHTTTIEPPFFGTDEATTIKPIEKPHTTVYPVWRPTQRPQSEVVQQFPSSSTTEKTRTTRIHRPGLYAPIPTKEIQQSTSFNLLNYLPALVLRIFEEETPFPTNSINDITGAMEILHDFDDNIRFNQKSTALGKKRVPPTKPYVEFVILYDLLKRDAKTKNLSKYEGYSKRILEDLQETSTRSAERQLHTVLTRMISRKDVDRSDVITRVNSIIKDLENPKSATSMILRYSSSLQF